MFSTLHNYLSLAWGYISLNFNAQLEYRGAFISQVVAMFINNIVWVAFWALFFTRFPVLRGWTVQDVITVWALTATGFGWVTALAGNAQSLPTLIAEGQLDVWMLYPRALLPHLILGRMSAAAWGDVLFGYVVYILFVQPDWAHFLLFLGLTFSVGLLFLGFFIATSSLSFYLGNAKGIAEQLHFAMIIFSTYPAILFDGRVKLLLYTLIPAAFVTELPIEALRQLSLYHAGLALLGSLTILLIGTLVFYHGLRRYESGNLMQMRG